MNAVTLSKRLKMPREKAIRFYLLTELVFFRKLDLITSDLDLLTLLLLHGEGELPAFCALAARHFNPDCAPEDLSTREQNVRNRLVKLEKRQLVYKHKPGPKTLVAISSDLALPLSEAPLLLDFQFLGLAST